MQACMHVAPPWFLFVRSTHLPLPVPLFRDTWKPLSVSASLVRNVWQQREHCIWGGRTTGVGLAWKDLGSPCVRCHITITLPPSSGDDAQVYLQAGGSPKRLLIIHVGRRAARKMGWQVARGEKLKNELRTLVPSEHNGRAFDHFLSPVSLLPRMHHRPRLNLLIRHVVCVSTRHHPVVKPSHSQQDFLNIK